MASGPRRRHRRRVTSTAQLLRPLAPVADLGARRRLGQDAVVRAASAPVLHVTEEFLAALNCREIADLPSAPRTLRAVGTG